MNKISQKSKTTSRIVLVVFALIMFFSAVFAQSVKVTDTVINNEAILLYPIKSHSLFDLNGILYIFVSGIKEMTT